MTMTGTKPIQTQYLPRMLTFLLVLLAGCSNDPVDMANLTMRNGVAYVKGTLDRYDGDVVAYYPQTPKEIAEKKPPRLHQKGAFRDGLKTETWITYGWNNEREEIPYENGKRHGKAIWYYPGTGATLPTWMEGADKGVKRDQHYANDMMHGPGASYDMQGNITKQVFYDRNQLIQTPENRMDGIPKIETTRETYGVLDRLIQRMRGWRQ